MGTNNSENNTDTSSKENTNTVSSGNVIGMTWQEYDRCMEEIEGTQESVKSHTEEIIDKK